MTNVRKNRAIVILLLILHIVKPGKGILNCLIARKLCQEDTACSAILEVLPKVCGQELVACATLTVTKCQAALRTLKAYPLFRPTCLCKEPHLEPECNAVRDFLFDHPCMVAMQREKDPYPIDALPLCTHAVSVCNRDRKCVAAHDEFKEKCKVRDNQCRMTDKDACYAAWTKIRLSPVFGCICPADEVKKKCERHFSAINHNPCIGSIISFNFVSQTDFAPMEKMGKAKRDLTITIKNDESNSVSLLCQAAQPVGTHVDVYHVTKHKPSRIMDSPHIEDTRYRLINFTSDFKKKGDECV